MSEQSPAKIGWIDLTVDDAEGVRDFYRDVVGFETSAVGMGEYDDYCLHPPGGEVVVGPKPMGGARYAVVRDLAGAASALFQPAS